MSRENTAGTTLCEMDAHVTDFAVPQEDKFWIIRAPDDVKFPHSIGTIQPVDVKKIDINIYRLLPEAIKRSSAKTRESVLGRRLNDEVELFVGEDGKVRVLPFTARR